MIRFHLKGVLGVKGVQGDLSKEILSYVNGPLSKEIVYLSMILLKTLSAQAHTHMKCMEMPRSKRTDLRNTLFYRGKKPNEYKHAQICKLYPGFFKFYLKRWQDFKFVEHYAGVGELTNTMREVHGPSARLDLQYHRGHDILTPAGMA
jgi:hypothetical protein